MKGLLLLSSGFDSVVAASVMKKYAALEALHFHYDPLTDRTSVEKAKKLCKIVGIKKLHVLPSAHFQAAINKECKDTLFFVLTKRMMIRIASQFAQENGFDFMVSGESLGQVASQTLTNLSVIADATSIPLFRPLLTWDKQEIIDEAKRIGTYETSLGPEMCNILGSKSPATKANLKRVRFSERSLDIPSLIAEAFEGREEYLF